VTRKKLFRLMFMSAIAILSISVLVATGCKSTVSSNPKNANPEAGSTAEATSAIVPTIERLDPMLEVIVPAQARLEKLAIGFIWTEGPVWIKSGYLMFAYIPSNSIRKWTPGARASIFLQPSGYRGAAPYGGPEPGVERDDA
jgi:gluconolactonase